MKRLYDWFWEEGDAADGWWEQRAIIGFFGMAVLAFGLLLLWFAVYVSDVLGWNQ